MALSLNGKRARLRRADFVALGENLHMAEKAIDATFERFARVLPGLRSTIESGFLSPDMKATYSGLVADRCNRLGIG